MSEDSHTCNNCAKQLRDLKDTIRHRQSSKLINQKIQVKKNRYVQVGEMREALDVETSVVRVPTNNYLSWWIAFSV